MKKQSESISLSGGDVFILFDDEPYTLVDHPRSKIIDCSEVEKLRVHNVLRSVEGSTNNFCQRIVCG